MIRSKGDLSLYYKKGQDSLVSVTSKNSDDPLSCGTWEFMQVTDKSLQRFEFNKKML